MLDVRVRTVRLRVRALMIVRSKLLFGTCDPYKRHINQPLCSISGVKTDQPSGTSL
jgi:hypothetical protein